MPILAWPAPVRAGGSSTCTVVVDEANERDDLAETAAAVGSARPVARGEPASARSRRAPDGNARSHRPAASPHEAGRAAGERLRAAGADRM